MTLTYGSLFTGAGGMDLGVDAARWVAEQINAEEASWATDSDVALAST